MKIYRIIDCCTKLVLLSSILFTVLVIGKHETWEENHKEPAKSISTQIEIQESGCSNYRVLKIFPSTQKDEISIAVVWVDSGCFNKEDLKNLALKLNEEFVNEKKIKAGLSDDETTAQLFVDGKVNYPTYEKTERGRYYLDHTECKSYIEYYKQNKEHKEIQKIECQNQ